MARLARDSSDMLKPTIRTPHRVALPDAYDRVTVHRWIRGKDAVGHFRVDHGFRTVVFYFSDENTALDFKMRWG